MSIVKEFQDFIARGNAIDLAVGLIMGTAFNKIVTSIVNDLVMPPIGYMIGGVDFNKLVHPIAEATKKADGTVVPAVEIRYGAFLSAVIEFFIIALTVFFIVKFVNHLASYREALTPAFLRGDEEAAEKKDTPPTS